ncbi:MAG: ABC transporter substrate-binding protein [Sporolactobacillus sp.]|jgi:iron complex transport system substrate-binding protein|nr:ABC transporter substrate-binding protein [Sporolactobacillus sp.]
MQNNRKLFRLVTLVCSLLLLVGLLASCAQSGSSGSGSSTASSSSAASTQKKKVITDSTGTKVTVPSKINKIADAWPAHNEIVGMLGSADKIVATIDSKQQYPWLYKVFPEMDNAKTIFTKTTVNTDTLAQLNPDILFTSPNPQLIKKTKELGIPTMQLIFQNYNDLKKIVSITAKTLGGAAPAKAKKYNTYLTTQLSQTKAITDQISESQKPRILHIETFKPLVIDGKDTIVDEWIRAGGGRDAAGIAGNQKPASLEQVIKWNPDVIVVGKSAFTDPKTTFKNLQALYKNPQWSQIKAVKNHKVLINPMGVFLWDRYGMESALQFQWLAKTLHPKQFEDLDLVKETQTFYRDFLNYDLTIAEANKILKSQNP